MGDRRTARRTTVAQTRMPDSQFVSRTRHAMTSRITVPVDVGEPEVAARVAVGEPGVVEAHQVQDRGVEVVDVDGILGGAVAVVVGDAVAESRLRRRRRRGSR